MKVKNKTTHKIRMRTLNWKVKWEIDYKIKNKNKNLVCIIW